MGCSIYRVLVSRGMLILMTSSIWWYTSPLYAGFHQKRGNSLGDAGIKGAFFPPEGQFLPGYRRGKYVNSSYGPFQPEKTSEMDPVPSNRMKRFSPSERAPPVYNVYCSSAWE